MLNKNHSANKSSLQINVSLRTLQKEISTKTLQSVQTNASSRTDVTSRHHRGHEASTSQVDTPTLGKLRYAHVFDAPKINALINDSMKHTFRVHSGVESVRHLIEEGGLSIVQLDTARNVIGFLSLKSYPLIPSIYPSAFEEYIWTKFNAVELTCRNSLYIHLMCWNLAYKRDIVENMLFSVFMSDPYVHYISMLKTDPDYPFLIPGQSRTEASFRRVVALERDRDVQQDKLPVLYIAERHEICPRMKVRRAVEEDNDDLIPIVDRQSKRLRELYGDFYIAELVSQHPELDRAVLVMEHKEYARGLMVLNTQINYAVLEECFDLAPFAGLRKNSVKHILDNIEEPIPEFDSATGFELIEETIAADKSWRSERSRSERSLVKKIDACSEAKDGGAEPKQETPWSFEIDHNFAELALLSLVAEDEETDFEIINIDPAYLTRASLLPLSEDLPFLESLKQLSHETERELTFEERKAKKLSTTLSAHMFVKPSNNLKESKHVVRYTGEPNAFIIELYAIHPNYDERYGFDMLEVAFEIYPDREYCILCLPSSHTVFPLLEHFSFVTSKNTKMRFANETLYVAHVNSVRGLLKVRLAEACDLPHVNDIAEHVPRPEEVTELFQESLLTTEYQSFLLLSEQQPVGLCILGPLEERGSIRAQYTLEPEPRKPGTDASVVCGILSPLFDPHGRWFMREIIRQSKFNSLFYKLTSLDITPGKSNLNMCSLVEKMKPIRKRLVVPNITGYPKLDEIFKTTGPPFSLWILERPLTYKPKVYVNNSIVVVGASRTALAFFEELILGSTSQYLAFTNLTLVSDNCRVMFTEVLRSANTCIPWRGRLTDKYLRTVPFSVYVDTIADIMVRIDRKNKCIYLKGGGVKFYDELVLAMGLQFQHPDYMKESLQRVAEYHEGKHCTRLLMDNPAYEPDEVPPKPHQPENVMLINSLHTANTALRKLLHFIGISKSKPISQERPIVVYGECLEVYTCMMALLELGVSPPHIAFVEAFPHEDPNALRVNSFNDELVDGRVLTRMMEMGFRIIHEHTLMDWQTVDDHVVSIRFMGPLSVITLPCFALFYFGTRGLNINAFRAINSCGLVYDGGVVVGPLFETNDPRVRAAGTCCSYSRRLYAANELHRYYQSEEIGVALANIMLRKLNPFTMGDASLSECPSDLFPRFSDSFLSATLEETDGTCVLGDCTNRTWQPVMKFKRPLTRFAKLPGPLYYFKMRPPGSERPTVVEEYLPRVGHKLVTDKDGNYFSMSLDSRHCITSITCLSKKPFASEIFCQMFGKHEAFFNKMLAKYYLKQIDDFYEYFTQPWMSALYQEVFTEVLENVKEDTMDVIYEKLKNSEGFDATCESCKCSELRKECGQPGMMREMASILWERSGGEASVMEHLARFLTQHVDTNPHYAQPGHRVHAPADNKGV